MIQITDKDLGFKALKKRLEEFKKAVIKVGVQGRDASVTNKGVTVANYAAQNEFGATIKGVNGDIIIPERSFLRSTTDKKQGWKEELKKSYENVFDGKDTALSAIAKVGIIARDDIIKTITNGVPPPNALSTIRKKKSDKPLIDTGTLRNSISYKFANKDGN